MSKKIYLFILALLVLIITSIVIISMRYKYEEKDKNKIYVTNKGKALELNNKIFKNIIKDKYPNKEIVYKNISNPDLLIVSHFFTWEDYLLYVDNKTPYISWSGESIRVKGYEKGISNLLSIKPTSKEDKWLPFLVAANYHANKGIDNILNKNYKPIEERENFVAYINSHDVNIRNNFFRLLEKKSKTAHAMGKCCNNYKKAEGVWDALDKVYEDYIFGFAMENSKVDGYITEKILNIYNAGAIPIFWGDSKSAEYFFNKDTYIDISDFQKLEEASDYIYNLSLDKEKLKEIKSRPVFKDPKIFQDIDYCFEKLKLK